MPNTHYLCQSERAGALIAQADCILSLEPVDLFGQLNTMRDQLERTDVSQVTSRARRSSASRPTICWSHSNYQDFQRYVGADINITGRRPDDAAIPDRGRAARDDRQRQKRDRDARREAAPGLPALRRTRAQRRRRSAWDASPITTARLYMELWAQIKNEDWALVSDSDFSSRWPHRLWPLDKHYQLHRRLRRLRRRLQPVGSARRGAGAPRRRRPRRSSMSPATAISTWRRSTLWTAAHHQIPLPDDHPEQPRLSSGSHARPAHGEPAQPRHRATRMIGTTIDNPNIDYAKIAQGLWRARHRADRRPQRPRRRLSARASPPSRPASPR